jgi:hypothetical protein
MRIPYTKHDLASTQLSKLASLAVVQRFAEFKESHGGEGGGKKLKRF